MEPDVNAAIKKGLFQQVRFLLQLGVGGGPDCRDEERRTPLMNCALIEDESWGVGLARLLIEKGASMRSLDRRGLNALHYACLYGRRHLADVLLRSPDFDINRPDRHGNTPLHYAAMTGHVGLVEVLAEAVRKYELSLDHANRLGYTALMQAWRTDNEACARILIARGADVTRRDDVNAMTAEDYEDEYRLRLAERRDNRSRRSRRLFFDLTQQRRPFSAMSALSRSTRQGSAQLGNRPSSSRLLDRRMTNGTDKSANNRGEADYIEKIQNDRQAGRLIRTASLGDMRNKPEQLLNISPVECFVNQSRHLSVNRFGGEENSDTCWKSEIKRMYSAFQYQFTPSYRKPAQPREPEAADNCEEAAACSPIPSENDPAAADRNKKNRKSSNKGAPDEKKLRKLSGKLSRKSSNVSLKSQQALVDCSSNESLNSAKKANKKRAPDGAVDVTDASVGDKAAKTDKNGKARTRKISAALDDHVTTADQSARGPTAPGIKEPVGQDQLGAIRE